MSEYLVVSRKAWEEATSLIRLAASGTYGGDDDWEAVVIKHSRQWLKEHLEKTGTWSRDD